MTPRTKIYYTDKKERKKKKMYSSAPTTDFFLYKPAPRTDELSTFLTYYIGYLLPPI